MNRTRKDFIMTLYHFVEDGYTHGDKVYLRGEMVEVDTKTFPHFQWDADEQVQAYGKVFWKKGPWDGALFDLDDPELTPSEREKLEEANEEIIRMREEAKKTPVVEDEEPQEKPPVPRRRAKANPSVVIKNTA